MYDFFYNAAKDQHERNFNSLLKGAEDLGYIYGLGKSLKAAKKQLEDDIASKADTPEMAQAKKDLQLRHNPMLADKTAKMQDLQARKAELLQYKTELEQKIANLENGSFKELEEE